MIQTTANGPAEAVFDHYELKAKVEANIQQHNKKDENEVVDAHSKQKDGSEEQDKTNDVNSEYTIHVLEDSKLRGDSLTIMGARVIKNLFGDHKNLPSIFGGSENLSFL